MLDESERNTRVLARFVNRELQRDVDKTMLIKSKETSGGTEMKTRREKLRIPEIGSIFLLGADESTISSWQ